MTDDEIYTKIKTFDEACNYDAIIDFIASLEKVDFKTALELARAHINKANDSDKDLAYKLYSNASDILDAYAQKGKDSAQWLFLKGYTLFKLNLIPEAVIRFDRAMRFVGVNDGDLFNKISSMQRICKNLESRLDERLDDADKDILDRHIKKYFGSFSVIDSCDSIDIIDIAPGEDHNYHVVMTRGLSAFVMQVPDGVDKKLNSRIELGIILPLKWDMTQIWPFELLKKLSMLLKSGNRFLGFGFTFDNGTAMSDTSLYQGAMLTALGDYTKEAQSFAYESQESVNLFQVVPLMPMEVAFRQKHSAGELLDLFKLRHVTLSPLVEGREDVCLSIGAKSL